MVLKSKQFKVTLIIKLRIKNQNFLKRVPNLCLGRKKPKFSNDFNTLWTVYFMSAHIIASHRENKQLRSDRLVVLLLFKGYISTKHVKTSPVSIIFTIFAFNYTNWSYMNTLRLPLDLNISWSYDITYFHLHSWLVIQQEISSSKAYIDLLLYRIFTLNNNLYFHF